VGSRNAAKPMQTAAPAKDRRRWRANVRNSGCVELMKAAEAAAESAGGSARRCGLRSRMETGRRMDPA
jgi:hypothetical protein